MITKLLFILQLLSLLEQPAADMAPCTLDMDISIVQVLWDDNDDAEITSEYEIRRLSDQTVIRSGDFPMTNGKLTWAVTVKDKQGSNCEKKNESTGYNRTVWAIKNYSFNKCGGDFQIKTTGLELDRDNPHDKMWVINKTFKCDGKEFKERDCQLNETNSGGGGEVRITCTNLWSIDLLFPPFIKYLKESFQNQIYNVLYGKYSDLLTKLYNGGLNYFSELESCSGSNWLKYDSCKALFLQPIIGVIASFRNQASQIDNPFEIDKWTGSQFLSRNEWNERSKAKEMIDLMKFVLSKDQLDDGFFTREMVYTMLSRKNQYDFPLKDSPFARRGSNGIAQSWYEYAKSANEAKLQELFNLKVDLRVKDFCMVEKQKSLLCSVLAAKNNYYGSRMYLQQSNSSSPISISAYVGQDGRYGSFKKSLDIFLQTATITDSVARLGGQISNYYQTMAGFDKANSKADAEYLQSAVKKNNERIVVNLVKFDELLKEIGLAETNCRALDIFEAALIMTAVVVVGLATGGAGLAMGSATIPATFAPVKAVAIKTINTMPIIMQSVQDLNTISMKVIVNDQNRQDFLRTTGDVGGALFKTLDKLKQNSERIDDMRMIQDAAIYGKDFNTIQKEVDRFLTSDANYEPAVSPTDLTELNTKFKKMFDSMEKTFSDGGFFCKAFVSSHAITKVKVAEDIWTSIFSTLKDIHGKQSELITALVKVVRSGLSEAAAIKYLEPDVNYNFEIAVGYMLSLRASAQQVCDTYQFMNNDVPDEECKNIRNNIFLSEMARSRIFELDQDLQKRLDSPVISIRYPIIPVGDGSSTGGINWDDLISGKVIEFALPPTDSSIATNNRWIEYPGQLALLKSLQIFIPNNLVPNAPNANKERVVMFLINATQDGIVVNSNPNAQRYTIKSRDPIFTVATYRVNAEPCGDEKAPDLFPNDVNSKYCIIKGSGRFGTNIKLLLPVSMYSKFQIQLYSGYDKSTLPILRAIRPVGDTLKLRASVELLMNAGAKNPGAGFMSLPTSRLPNTDPCGPGQYRRIIDANREDCVPCPPGSVPYAQGSYCISDEAAKKIAGMGITSAGSLQPKQFASASDKETVITEPIKAKTNPSLFQRFKNWIG